MSDAISLSYPLVTEDDRLDAVVLEVSPLLPVERELFLRCLHFLLKDGKRLVIRDMELITNSPDFCCSCGDCELEVGRSFSSAEFRPRLYSKGADFS